MEKNVSLISTMEPLQNIIPTDSESYSAGLQLSFFFDDFRKLVM